MGEEGRDWFGRLPGWVKLAIVLVVVLTIPSCIRTCMYL